MESSRKLGPKKPTNSSILLLSIDMFISFSVERRDKVAFAVERSTVAGSFVLVMAQTASELRRKALRDAPDRILAKYCVMNGLPEAGPRSR